MCFWGEEGGCVKCDEGYYRAVATVPLVREMPGLAGLPGWVYVPARLCWFLAGNEENIV